MPSRGEGASSLSSPIRFVQFFFHFFNFFECVIHFNYCFSTLNGFFLHNFFHFTIIYFPYCFFYIFATQWRNTRSLIETHVCSVVALC